MMSDHPHVEPAGWDLPSGWSDRLSAALTESQRRSLMGFVDSQGPSMRCTRLPSRCSMRSV